MTRPQYDPRAGSGGNPFPTAVILRTAGTNRTIDAEWVLVGWRENGRCRLLASEDIDHATLSFARVQQQYVFTDADDLRRRGIRAARHIDADVLSYVLIEADTYAECLAALLFGYQWKPDTIRMIRNPEGMGRNDGPSVQTAPLCLHRPAGMSVMYCDQPAGHYPDTQHAHTLTWDEDDDQAAQLALEGKQDPT